MNHDILHFMKEEATPVGIVVYFNRSNNHAFIKDHLFNGDPPDDIFLVPDEEGFEFISNIPDNIEDHSHYVYSMDSSDIALGLRHYRGETFSARIDTEVGGEGYRTCDFCGRATLAGEAPDWSEGICERCA